MGAVDVATETTIRRPCAEVAAYAADPGHAPDWYVNIESALVARFHGSRLAYTYVVEYVPGVRLVMRTSDGPFPMETSYAWEALDEATTRMRLRNRGRPSGFSKWLTPFMSMAMRRANRQDLARLRHLLESSATD